MTLQNDVRDFLMSRRARITPENAGLPAYGGKRRVTGLRREEVALLAGVSVDYYNRLERGNLRGVSEGVLDSVARVLQLDEVEHAHLRDLARAANAAPAKRRRASPQSVRPSLQRLLDAMTETAAGVLNNRLDVLATNRLGRALYAGIFSGSEQPANLARFAFLGPRGKDIYADWEATAEDTVAILRSAAGSNPYDRDLSNLIGELSTRSEDFRSRWRRTMSGSIAPVRRGCTTPSSAISHCRSRPWTSAQIQVSCSWPTPPKPAPPPRTPCGCSRAGPRRRSITPALT
jgi:hypothetical protein